jgi:hypothetical protein
MTHGAAVRNPNSKMTKLLKFYVAAGVPSFSKRNTRKRRSSSSNAVRMATKLVIKLVVVTKKKAGGGGNLSSLQHRKTEALFLANKQNKTLNPRGTYHTTQQIIPGTPNSPYHVRINKTLKPRGTYHTRGKLYTRNPKITFTMCSHPFVN